MLIFIIYYIYHILYIEMLRASVEELNEMQGKIRALTQKQTHIHATTHVQPTSPSPPDFNRD